MFRQFFFIAAGEGPVGKADVVESDIERAGREPARALRLVGNGHDRTDIADGARKVAQNGKGSPDCGYREVEPERDNEKDKVSGQGECGIRVGGCAEDNDENCAQHGH